MDHATFQGWLDRYIAAWRSGDPAEIGDLFSADARYSYGPYQDPVVGRAAIVASWTEEPDPPGSWEAEYHPLVVQGDTAVAVGETRYVNEHTFSNVFACRFDGEGRCADFREWYMQRSDEPQG
jgi:hypothetical protein